MDVRVEETEYIPSSKTVSVVPQTILLPEFTNISSAIVCYSNFEPYPCKQERYKSHCALYS